MSDLIETFPRILVPVDFVDAGDEETEKGSQSVAVEDHKIVFTEPTLRAIAMATSLGRFYGSTVRLVRCAKRSRARCGHRRPDGFGLPMK